MQKLRRAVGQDICVATQLHPEGSLVKLHSELMASRIRCQNAPIRQKPSDSEVRRQKRAPQ